MESEGHGFGYGQNLLGIGNVSARLSFPRKVVSGIVRCMCEVGIHGSWTGFRKPLRGGSWIFRKEGYKIMGIGEWCQVAGLAGLVWLVVREAVAVVREGWVKDGQI